MDIHESWIELFEQYAINLDKLEQPYYPHKSNVFKVFSMDVNEIQVVLLGQDPYHGPKQAHGLSFSVMDDINIPPSLSNIFKELKNEFPERNYKFTSGNLTKWFEREKIFLLNAALTVKPGKAGSHLDIWEGFTNDVIRFISIKNPNCVFLLLGNFAKKKSEFIENKNKIVYGVHPSPLSAYNGFFNSNIFISVEQLLGKQIDWNN